MKSFYMKNYKKLLLIPFILLGLSVLFLSVQYANNGYIIDKDVSLKGGISATIYFQENIDTENLKTDLQEKYPNAEISVRGLSTLGSKQDKGIILETTDIELKELTTYINTNFPTADISIQQTGESLGKSFFNEMLKAIFFAFILMGIVVFVTFRKFVPSIAVILSAFLDITITLAIISALGMKISTAGIAAFLMIIGYSIDTDIMLTTKVLKRKSGDLWDRIVIAFKTGMTMTITTIIALFIAFLITNSIILKQMFGIILIALLVDMLSTWLMNTGILVWYLEK